MHDLVEVLDCLDDHYHFVFSCVCALGRGDFFGVLRPVSPAQFKAGI